MITYKLGRIDPLTNEPMCIHRSDNTAIPLVPANTDYQAYLLGLAEGNTPEAAE
jgi:hypothetical protein